MINVLDSLLRPIARLAIARGVLFGQVADRLKLQFLHGAKDLAEDGKLTDSRLSVMTGLQRRDIARLRDQSQAPAPVANHLARLVSVWHQSGKAVLSRKAFDALAQDIRRDVHPRTMLEQLVHAGTIEVVGDQVTLLATSYQPLPGSEDQLDYLGRNGGDFLTAATANVMQDPAPFFERAAHFNGLSEDAVAALEAEYKEKQMALLHDIGAKAAKLQDSAPGQHRFRAGGYFYKEDTSCAR